MKGSGLLVFLLVALVAVLVFPAFAIDPGDCEYVKGDKTQIDKNGYIMSFLVLDPYIKVNVGATASTGLDYFEDQGGEANLMPKEGDEVIIKETKSKHIWTRLNFQDLKDMGQIPAPVGGNEFDISCWGGVDNAVEYLVTYLKWNSNTDVILTLSADDGAESFMNGEQVTFKAADQDWAAGNGGSGNTKVNAGEWNILVVQATETGGEWGISVQVAPIPDEIDTGPPIILVVGLGGKLSTAWGKIKQD